MVLHSFSAAECLIHMQMPWNTRPGSLWNASHRCRCADSCSSTTCVTERQMHGQLLNIDVWHRYICFRMCSSFSIVKCFTQMQMHSQCISCKLFHIDATAQVTSLLWNVSHICTASVSAMEGFPAMQIHSLFSTVFGMFHANVEAQLVVDAQPL